MAYTLQLFDDVIQDVAIAKEWYKEQKQGLEEDFANAIENTLALVLKNPKAYTVRYKKIRIVHPKKFPYNIHFFIDDQEMSVIITAIIHSSRHPKIAKKRI